MYQGWKAFSFVILKKFLKNPFIKFDKLKKWEYNIVFEDGVNWEVIIMFDFQSVVVSTTTANILLSLAIALLGGLFLSRLAKKIHLPAVTAYLVAGILVGPYVLGLAGIDGLGFTKENIKSFNIVSELALGFIAFSMGNEFRLSQLKEIGKHATIIGIAQAVITTIVVDLALIATHFMMPDKLSLASALVLGAVATATAPAATLMVVHQYKAEGPVTKTLLPVVAIDDAVGLVVFAISFGIAESISSGQINILATIFNPLIEIVVSLCLGAILGLLFSWVERFFHSRSKRMAMTVAFIMLGVGLSCLKFDLGGGIEIASSSLLCCMMLGTIFCNTCDFSEELMNRADRWSTPVLVLFFVISGASLELSIFTDGIIVLVGVIYIIARSLGKYFGAGISAKMTHADPMVNKYLGITLLPQAGVALGMAMKALELGPEGQIVSNITLFAVLVYELVGPLFTKIALTKAGEIKSEGATTQRIPENKNDNITPQA